MNIRRLKLADDSWRATRFDIATLTLVMAGLFTAMKLLQHAGFRTNDFDTGIYSNLAWNIAHGHGYYSAILDCNHLGEHFSPVIILLAPLYWVWPSASVLMIAQGLAVGITFGVLALLCDHILTGHPRSRVRAIGTALIVLFFLYRPLLAAASYEFHPSTLGVPMVAGAILCLHRRWDTALWCLVILLLSTKEVAILSVFGIAIYAGFVLRRWRIAAVLAVVAGIAGLVILGVVMPAARDGTWGQTDRLGPLEDLPAKGAYVLRLALGLGFLPLLGWRALLAAVPTTVLNLAVSYDPQFGLDHHYDDQNAVFWMVAAIHGAQRLTFMLTTRQGRRGMATMRAGVLAGIAAAAGITLGPTPVQEIARNWPTRLPERRVIRQRLERLDNLTRETGVVAQTGLGPHLCHRERYVSLRSPVRADVFKPNDLILLSGKVSAYGLDLEAARSLLRTDRRAVLVQADDDLEVYRWEGP